MTTIVTRAGKGSPLTNTEVDTNFTNLNTAKIETLTSTDSSVTITGTGDSRNLSVPTNPDVVSGPASATDNAVARYDGTTGKLIQNSVVTIDDTGNEAGLLSQQFSDGSAVILAAGKQWYNGTTGSWNLGMGGGNITQQVGEEIFYYGKASSAITDTTLQLVYKTGTVGASGVITFAPTVSGITDGDLIIGVATESIANNGFGRVTTFGVVNSITTNGTAYGETWADGDVIYYNPVTGNPTKVKPVAPNIKVAIGTVIKAGNGGSGSFHVEINHGSVLGGTDSNVQLTSVANGNLLTYDNGNGYWKNTDLTAGTAISVTKSANGVLTVANTGVTSVTASTGISVSSSTGGVTITNSAPDQTVALTAGTGISTSGTYPNFTITNSAPDQTVALTSGTGISVTGTYPNFTVTNTAPNVGSGTVTSVSGTGTASGLSLSGTVTTSGNITLSGTVNSLDSTASYTAVAFSATSDERLKTNWAGLSLDFVARLSDVKHGTFERINNGMRDVGVSAQSLQKLIPEAVVEKDGFLAVNYGGAALVAAIELAKQIQELRAEIAELKAKG